MERPDPVACPLLQKLPDFLRSRGESALRMLKWDKDGWIFFSGANWE